jgi:hypothetical protein
MKGLMAQIGGKRLFARFQQTPADNQPRGRGRHPQRISGIRSRPGGLM